MASVKVRSPATRGPGVQSTNDPILNQRELLERAGKGFEKFIQDSRQQNERAAEINVRLRALGLEGMTTREQFRDTVKGANLNTEDGAKRFVGLLALAKDFASLTPPIEEAPDADLHAERVVVDNLPTKEEDQAMSATTDKDYIDARLKAMSDSLDQRLETAAAKSDGRLEIIETRMDARVEAIDAKLAAGQASMEQLLARKFAEFDSTLHKSTADTVKWVAGTVLALGVIGISLMTFLLNNVAPKAPAAAPAPLIIYAQPTPAAAPPVAPTTK